jgi:ankyrin repeat protein
MLGAKVGNVEIIEALVAAGANVNAKTKTGMTALNIAKARGKDEAVSALKKAGAKE